MFLQSHMYIKMKKYILTYQKKQEITFKSIFTTSFEQNMALGNVISNSGQLITLQLPSLPQLSARWPKPPKKLDTRGSLIGMMNQERRAVIRKRMIQKRMMKTSTPKREATTTRTTPMTPI
jgi:hypothetical protein